MIKIAFNPKKYEVKITGHANYRKKGEDIVCAAVSTLFYTLGKALMDSSMMLEEPPICKDEPGNAIISCKPKPEYEGNIIRSYWTILEGFEFLAQNYEKNVRFTLVGEKKKSAKS